MKPFPEVQHVLKMLKETYKLALITNVPSSISVDYVNAGLRELGINEYFDVVLVSSDVGINKPGEEIFALALAKLTVKPEEAVMIENTTRARIFQRLASYSVFVIDINRC